MKHFLVAFLLISFYTIGLNGHQPFEPLFETEGVSPLVELSKDPDIIEVRTSDQFVDSVLESSGFIVLWVTDLNVEQFESADNGAASAYTSALKALSISHQARQVQGVVIDQSQSRDLLRSLGPSLGLRSVTAPSYILFYNGQAILPVGQKTLNKDELVAFVEGRLNFLSSQGEQNKQEAARAIDATGDCSQGISGRSLVLESSSTQLAGRGGTCPAPRSSSARSGVSSGADTGQTSGENGIFASGVRMLEQFTEQLCLFIRAGWNYGMRAISDGLTLINSTGKA